MKKSMMLFRAILCMAVLLLCFVDPAAFAQIKGKTAIEQRTRQKMWFRQDRVNAAWRRHVQEILYPGHVPGRPSNVDRVAAALRQSGKKATLKRAVYAPPAQQATVFTEAFGALISAPARPDRQYRVRSDQSLSDIVKRQYGTGNEEYIEKIATYNDMEPEEKLSRGRKIYLPDRRLLETSIPVSFRETREASYRALFSWEVPVTPHPGGSPDQFAAAVFARGTASGTEAKQFLHIEKKQKRMGRIPLKSGSYIFRIYNENGDAQIFNGYTPLGFKNKWPLKESSMHDWLPELRKLVDANQKENKNAPIIVAGLTLKGTPLAEALGRPVTRLTGRSAAEALRSLRREATSQRRLSNISAENVVVFNGLPANKTELREIGKRTHNEKSVQRWLDAHAGLRAFLAKRGVTRQENGAAHFKQTLIEGRDVIVVIGEAQKQQILFPDGTALSAQDVKSWEALAGFEATGREPPLVIFYSCNLGIVESGTVGEIGKLLIEKGCASGVLAPERQVRPDKPMLEFLDAVLHRRFQGRRHKFRDFTLIVINLAKNYLTRRRYV